MLKTKYPYYETLRLKIISNQRERRRRRRIRSIFLGNLCHRRRDRRQLGSNDWLEINSRFGLSSSRPQSQETTNLVFPDATVVPVLFRGFAVFSCCSKRATQPCWSCLKPSKRNTNIQARKVCLCSTSSHRRRKKLTRPTICSPLRRCEEAA